MDAEKATCVFNNLISCSCFVFALKESDSSIQDDLNSLSPEDAALTENAVLSDREMRDLMMSCIAKDDGVAKTIGVQTGTCYETQEKNADAVLASFVTALAEVLDADAKNTLDTLLSGQESTAVKINMLEESEFVKTENSNGKIKESLSNFIDKEDFSSTEDITCI